MILCGKFALGETEMMIDNMYIVYCILDIGNLGV